MPSFDKKDFGNNIKKARKSKGLSQENLAYSLGKSTSTITRYEKGEILPNAFEISQICSELNITESELFNSDYKIRNSENNINPFNTKTLFISYIAFYQSSKKYDLAKFKLEISEKDNKCFVDLVDYKTNKIYLSGYMLSDTNMATFVLENYKPINPRLETTLIIVYTANGIDNFMLGSICGTNAKYMPSIRKCIVSKNDFELSKTILDKLKISNYEKNELNETEILYLDLISKDDFEE